MAQQNNTHTLKTPSSVPRLALPLPPAAQPQPSTPTSATPTYPSYPAYYSPYATLALSHRAGTPGAVNPAQAGPSTPYAPQQQAYAYGQQAQVYASPYLHSAASYRNSPTPQSPYVMGANTPYSYPTSTQQAVKPTTTAAAPSGLALPGNAPTQQPVVPPAGRATGKKATNFKGAFTKDLRNMMYGFGDDPNPAPDSVNVLEEILMEYITDVCATALRSSKKHTIKLDDLRRVLSRPADAKKLARMEELLFLQEDIKRARSQFNPDDEAIAEEAVVVEEDLALISAPIRMLD